VVAGMVTQIVGELGKNPAAMSREEKMEVVKRLEERGAFLVKRSAEQIAEALDLSRYTIFAYLKEIRHGDGGATVGSGDDGPGAAASQDPAVTASSSTAGGRR
jgi:transposase-like protein